MPIDCRRAAGFEGQPSKQSDNTRWHQHANCHSVHTHGDASAAERTTGWDQKAESQTSVLVWLLQNLGTVLPPKLCQMKQQRQIEGKERAIIK